MKRFAPFAALTLALLASACTSAGSRPAPANGSKPAVAVELAAAAAASLEESEEVTGSLEPKFSADIKSEVTAVVSEVLVTEWVRVRKGALLARLDAEEWLAQREAAKAAVLRAEVEERRAQREMERATNLKGAGLLTQQTLDDARSMAEAATAAVAAARAQLRAAEVQLTKSEIRAPMDGVIAFRGVSPGDRVENMGSDKPMFRVVDPSILQLTVEVPSRDMAALRTGQSLVFDTDGLPGREFSGIVGFINPAVDPTSRSVKVTADVPNATGELRGGLFVRGRIVTSRRPSVLQVPRAALQRWDPVRGAAEVFVAEGDRAVRREVKVGVVGSDRVEIAAGLAPGDRVVVRGAFNLQDGDRVKIVAPGV